MPRCDNCCFSTYAAEPATKPQDTKASTGTEEVKKWAVTIMFDNKTYHLSYFGDEINATKAYD